MINKDTFHLSKVNHKDLEIMDIFDEVIDNNKEKNITTNKKNPSLLSMYLTNFTKDRENLINNNDKINNDNDEMKP